MHEISLMEQALKAVFKSLAQAGGKRITRVSMDVGRLSGVVPDALQFAFEALTPGTPAEGALLEIRECPAVGACEPCAKRFNIDGFDYSCPDCGGFDVDLVSGREFQLTTMEID